MQLSGTWYPDTESEIKDQLAAWQSYIEEDAPKTGQIVAAIAPHAGWFFSGKLAAKTIYLAAKSFGPKGPELVVVLGGHLPVNGPLVTFSETGWSTPLGHLEMQPELNELIGRDLSPRIWEGFTDDNTIEIQLPLVKLLCPNARLWPLRVSPGEAALALAQLLWELTTKRKIKVLVLASTDLTHYGRMYGFAPAGGGLSGEQYRRKNDLTFIQAALKPDPQEMMITGCENQAACSAGAAAAAAQLAALAGAKADLVDHYSSYDVIPGEQSVGYAGIIYSFKESL
jgi:AmmeMemoRadiSam system protein B